MGLEADDSKLCQALIWWMAGVGLAIWWAVWQSQYVVVTSVKTARRVRKGW